MNLRAPATHSLQRSAPLLAGLLIGLVPASSVQADPFGGTVHANGSRVCDSSRNPLAAIDASYTLTDNGDKIIYAAGVDDSEGAGCDLAAPGPGHTLQFREVSGTWANVPTSSGAEPFLASSGTVLVNNTGVSAANRRGNLTGTGSFIVSGREFEGSQTLDYAAGEVQKNHTEAQWALDFSNSPTGTTYEFRVRWYTEDCGECYVVYPSQITTAGGGSPLAMSSAADQVFFISDASTAMSQITITDETPASITAANDLRIRIPAGFNMVWDNSVTTATIGGAASSNVSTTVTYEDSDATLVLDVTGDFGDGDAVTVSGLRFTGFTAASASANLEIEVNDDDVVTATDDRTIEIGAPNFRSIGTDVGDRYSVGDASTTAGSAVVTFGGGAVLPGDVGAGDRLSIGGGSSTLFSDDFEDDTITGWTKLSGTTMVESAGVFQTQSGVNTDTRYSVTAGAAWDDYTFSAGVKSVDDDDSGLMFRIQNTSNYYLFVQKFGNSGNWDLSLKKSVGGSQSDLATAISNYGSSPGQVDSQTTFYELKVELSGTGIKAYVDGVLKFDITDSTYLTGTCGFYLKSQMDGEFDDALVTGAAGAEELYIASRDSDTQVTLQADAGTTQSAQAYTIERAYNTLQAWEDDREGDLVAESRREVGVCYNDGAFTDRLVISGSTTDAKYYMALTVPPVDRHDGIADSGARIDAGGGWSSENAIDVEDEYTRVEWLEIANVLDAGDGIAFADSPAADSSTVTGVFVHGFWQNNNAAFRVAADNVTIRNCIATGGSSYAARIEPTGVVMIENCTFWGFSGGGYGVHGAAGSDVGVRNTISVDHGGLDVYIETGGGATISYFGYNMFSTHGGGFNPGAYAGHNRFPPANLEHLFADLSTEDLHLEVSGNYAGNNGLDLSGDFADDVDGETRTGTWDIGADEGRTGTDPATPKIIAWQEVER